jgi:hypothetical protein
MRAFSKYLLTLFLLLACCGLILFIGCDTGTDGGDGDDDGDGDGDGDGEIVEYSLAWALDIAADVADGRFADPILLGIGANDLGDDGLLRNAHDNSAWFFFYGENGDHGEADYIVYVFYDGSTDFFQQNFTDTELPDYDDAKDWLDAADAELGVDHSYAKLSVYADEAGVFADTDNVAKVTYFVADDTEVGEVYLDADDYTILQ